jgi:hypothetical protein
MEKVILDNSHIQQQIIELLNAYSGLSEPEYSSTGVIISGSIFFSAAHKDMEVIEACFDINLFIPSNYPRKLPIVRETANSISKDFQHINGNGTLCLAAPIEIRKIFNKKPTLLGFIDNLVVPYFYSYCYWKQHGQMPFGELPHYGDGILAFYKNLFGTDNELALVKGLYLLYKHGYRGHNPCLCGSGFPIRKCHKNEVWELSQIAADNDDLAEELLCIYNTYKLV